MATLAPLPSQGAGMAHYQHASSYHFTQDGVKEVARLFGERAQQWSADLHCINLSHDESNDTFGLQCPNGLGFQLDAMLGQVLRNLTEREAAVAEAGEREPMVWRFAESELIDVCDSGSLPGLDYDANSDSRDKLDAPVIRPSVDKHVLKMEAAGFCNKIKAFRIGEVPHSLRLRTRAHDHDDSFNVSKCVSMHVVHWIEETQKHAFNGSLGQPLQPLSDRQEDGLETLFDVTTFNDFTNPVRAQRRIEERVANPKAGQGDDWEFEGEEPSVNQWLVGMGKTRQIDPSVVPDAAKDAIKFTGGVSEYQNTLGRVRMPKGVPFAQMHEDSDSDDDGQDGAPPRKDFSALMNGNVDDEDESEESDTSSRSSGSTDGARPKSFAALIRGTPKACDSVESHPARNMKEGNVRPAIASQVSSQSGQRVSTQATSNQDETASSTRNTNATTSHAESWAVNDRRYTKIDAVGLAGNAASQARWELENFHFLEHHAGSYSSASSAVTGSAPMSISDGHHLFPPENRRVNLPPVTTPRSYDETVLGGAEPWAKNIAQSAAPTPSGKLIDVGNDVYNPSRSRVPIVPPGYFPPLGQSHQEPNKRGSAQKKPWPVQTQSVGQLIDLSDADVSTSQPVATRPPRIIKVLMPKPSQPPTEHRGAGLDDDEVIERLQPASVEKPKLRRTMGQRAQKKGKGKSVGPKKVVLPLPDPIPPPREKKIKKPTTPPQVETGQSDEPTRFAQEFTALFAETSDTFGEPTVLIQFGLALLDDSRALADARASRRDELQAELDSISANDLLAGFSTARFLRPLARQNVDAAFLLNLPQKLAGVLPEAYKPLGNAFMDFVIDVAILYEVTIVDSKGKRWTVTVCQPEEDEHPEPPTVRSVESSVANIYLHYALRVWDARVQLASTAGSEAKSTASDELLAAATSFALSFATREDSRESLLPGFEACIPRNGDTPVFAVHKVLAKRVYSQRMPITTNEQIDAMPNSDSDPANVPKTDIQAGWHVTQIWDLHLCAASKDSGTDIVAFANDESGMKDQGRIFWEAELRIDDTAQLHSSGDVAGNSAESMFWALRALENKVDEIVRELDDVGLGRTEPLHSKALARANKQKAQGKRGKELSRREQEYVPYW